jgi:hypothetical protein
MCKTCVTASVTYVTNAFMDVDQEDIVADSEGEDAYPTGESLVDVTAAVIAARRIAEARGALLFVEHLVSSTSEPTFQHRLAPYKWVHSQIPAPMAFLNLRSPRSLTIPRRSLQICAQTYHLFPARVHARRSKAPLRLKVLAIPIQKVLLSHPQQLRVGLILLCANRPRSTL